MFIYTKVNGLPYKCYCQFDIGAATTMMYEKNIRSLSRYFPEFNSRIKKYNPGLLLRKILTVENLKLDFGGMSAETNNCYVMEEYGDSLQVNSRNDSSEFQIGTVGVDIFQNKVLIIDYPNERFAICDEVPDTFKDVQLSDINLDKYGRVILPMKMKDHNYKIMFDNGSSQFPILANSKNISKFSTHPELDSFKISAWGNSQMVTARLITDTFELAGRKFCTVKAYKNRNDQSEYDDYDGITGNALFWDHLVIVDFKNKKFGVK